MFLCHASLCACVCRLYTCSNRRNTQNTFWGMRVTKTKKGVKKKKKKKSLKNGACRKQLFRCRRNEPSSAGVGGARNCMPFGIKSTLVGAAVMYGPNFHGWLADASRSFVIILRALDRTRITAGYTEKFPLLIEHRAVV